MLTVSAEAGGAVDNMLRMVLAEDKHNPDLTRSVGVWSS